MRRAYTHAAEFWNERCEMMQVWANQLDEWRRDGTLARSSETCRSVD